MTTGPKTKLLGPFKTRVNLVTGFYMLNIENVYQAQVANYTEALFSILNKALKAETIAEIAMDEGSSLNVIVVNNRGEFHYIIFNKDIHLFSESMKKARSYIPEMIIKRAYLYYSHSQKGYEINANDFN